MSTKKWIIISGLGAAALVAVLAMTKTGPRDSVKLAEPDSKGIITAQVPTGPALEMPIPATPASQAVSGPQVAASPLDSIAPPACKTSPKGDLVIDAQTRDDVELVTTLYKSSEGLAKLEKACEDQPLKAKQQMRDLHQQFIQYSQALTTSFPIEEQNEIPVEKLESVLLKGMHDLRVQYFGAERACAMYCEEEAMTKRMLNMAVDYKQKKPKANTAEAVGFAQAEILKEIEAKAQQEASQPNSVK